MRVAERLALRAVLRTLVRHYPYGLKTDEVRNRQRRPLTINATLGHLRLLRNHGLVVGPANAERGVLWFATDAAVKAYEILCVADGVR